MIRTSVTGTVLFSVFLLVVWMSMESSMDNFMLIRSLIFVFFVFYVDIVDYIYTFLCLWALNTILYITMLCITNC